MYSLKINYFLIGKETHCTDTFVTPEEKEEHGEFYTKRMTTGHFLCCMDDMCVEGTIDGAGTEYLLFDEKVCKYEDLEVGKYYVLFTDGNVVISFKELTEEDDDDCVYVNEMLVDAPYPEIDKTIFEAIKYK